MVLCLDFQPYVNEAKRRGLTCGIKQRASDFRQAFISQTQTKRKQLQYALKRLNFYSLSVDGLWGKGTKRGFESFVDNYGLKGKSESEIFRSLLSRVDVPSSFAEPKKTVTTSSSSSKSYYKGMKPIISNPSTSAEQAWAICAPQAKLAGRQASSSYRPSSSSIDCDFIGRSAFCDKSSSGGGFW